MFKSYSAETAPAGAAEVLGKAQQTMGFLPNIYAHMAASPTATQAYAQLSELLGKSSLSAPQLQIALLTTSVENACHFCVAAHTAGGTKAGAASQTLEAVRAGETPDDAADAALVEFVRQVVRERGWVGQARVQAFIDAGFSETQVLDVITAVALKTLSNYSNHIMEPELNPELRKFAWAPAAGQARAS